MNKAHSRYLNRNKIATSEMHLLPRNQHRLEPYIRRMRFKKPLTRSDLEDLKARNLDSPDMKAALWKVTRLRSPVLLTDRLQRILGTLPGQQGDLLEMIRTKLAEKPCVNEFPQLPADA